MHHGHGDGQVPWEPDANRKVSSASLVFSQFTTLSPASAFRHRGQSGTASHGLVRQCPVMDSRQRYSSLVYFANFQGNHFGSPFSLRTNILKGPVLQKLVYVVLYVYSGTLKSHNFLRNLSKRIIFSRDMQNSNVSLFRNYRTEICTGMYQYVFALKIVRVL